MPWAAINACKGGTGGLLLLIALKRGLRSFLQPQRKGRNRFKNASGSQTHLGRQQQLLRKGDTSSALILLNTQSATVLSPTSGLSTSGIHLKQ